MLKRLFVLGYLLIFDILFGIAILVGLTDLEYLNKYFPEYMIAAILGFISSIFLTLRAPVHDNYKYLSDENILPNTTYEFNPHKEKEHNEEKEYNEEEEYEEYNEEEINEAEEKEIIEAEVEEDKPDKYNDFVLP